MLVIDYLEFSKKQRARSRSVSIQDNDQPRAHLSRLNRYDPTLKQHRGSISLESDLDMIEEENSSKFFSFRKNSND